MNQDSGNTYVGINLLGHIGSFTTLLPPRPCDALRTAKGDWPTATLRDEAKLPLRAIGLRPRYANAPVKPTSQFKRSSAINY
ncbi:MAG: hypothetical protein F6K56_19785 [Moorea sp. SIO3G5]|nr:hypothetical protein [Moorena sp. SIO3G5]